MLGNGATQPHISLQGLEGWEQGARSAGQGVAALVLGGARLVQEREEVTKAGELAAFSQKLRSIEEETREELRGQTIRDWEYAWKSVSEPRVAEALMEIPLPLREQAQHMAKLYNQEAGVRALRDYELESINQAREQWQQRVDAAVNAGDKATARQWLERGRGIFLPENRWEEESVALESKMQLQEWRQRLQQKPLQSLGDYLHMTPDSAPALKKDADLLQRDVERVRQQSKEMLLHHWQKQIMDGITPAADEIDMAYRAGLVSTAQRDTALAEPAPLSTITHNDWIKRVDECDTTPEAQQEMRVDICTAALLPEARKNLLQRLEQASSIAREQRLSLSHKLWSLYRGGAFGCPADELAARRMLRLQMAGLPALAEQGPEAVSKWLATLDRRQEQWICFTPQQV